jgi:hypothetical protein
MPRAHQNAVRRLFEEEQNSVAIIKWKEEILNFLEAATDRCERRRQRPRGRGRQARLTRGWARLSSRSSR